MTSPSLTSTTRPKSVAAAALTETKVRSRKATTRLRAIIPPVWSWLDRELFRQFQLGFAQLETSPADVAFSVQCEHDEVILAEQPHQHHRTLKRDDELTQTTEPGVRTSPLGTSHERRKFRGGDVEICFRPGLAENLLDRNSIGSHYERTEAALGAFDNGLKHLLEHMASNYGRWPLSEPGRAVVVPAGLLAVGALSNCG